MLKDIPDDVLISDLLPYLSLKDLYNTYLVNVKMSRLCDNQILWKIKLRDDYPELSVDMNEPKRLYLCLYGGNKVLVIYHGDRIGYSYWNQSDRDMSNKLFKSLYPWAKYFYTLDYKNEAIYKWNTRYRVRIGQDTFHVHYWNTVFKIVITDKLSDGVYDGLTSLFGNPPIYGFRNEGDGKIYIEDERNPQKCMALYTCEEMVNRYPDVLDDLSKYSDANVEGDLCATLETKLRDIGHYLGTLVMTHREY